MDRVDDHSDRAGTSTHGPPRGLEQAAQNALRGGGAGWGQAVDVGPTGERTTTPSWRHDGPRMTTRGRQGPEGSSQSSRPWRVVGAGAPRGDRVDDEPGAGTKPHRQRGVGHRSAGDGRPANTRGPLGRLLRGALSVCPGPSRFAAVRAESFRVVRLGLVHGVALLLLRYVPSGPRRRTDLAGIRLPRHRGAWRGAPWWRRCSGSPPSWNAG